MYKVFFNGITIFLLDKLPDIESSGENNIIALRDIKDLKPWIMSWLNSGKGDLQIWHPDSDHLFDTFSSCFSVIHASGGLVKNSKDEDLIIFRRGVWDLPKGKTEPGESPEQTALREVQEECYLKGLKIRRFLVTTYHIYFLDDLPVLKKTRWYEMKYEGKEKPRPQRKEEITKIIWLPFSRLEFISGNTFPNVLEVIRSAEP